MQPERVRSQVISVAGAYPNLYLLLARGGSAEGTLYFNLTMENVMNDELEMDLEIVELGDAKQETKGSPTGVPAELGTAFPHRQE